MMDGAPRRRDPKELADHWAEIATARIGVPLVPSVPAEQLEAFAAAVSPSKPSVVAALARARHLGRVMQRAGLDVAAVVEIMSIPLELAFDGVREPPSSAERMLFSRCVGTATTAWLRERDRATERQARENLEYLAHELGTPLQTAFSAQSLLAHGGEETRDDALARLRASLARVRDEVRRALDSTPIPPTPSKEVRETPADDVVRAACDAVRSKADEQDLVLETQVESFDLLADPPLLVDALTQLLENAVAHTAAGGTVTISARAEADRALFLVTDECGGLPEGLPARLVQPHPQLSHKRAGLGEGLRRARSAARAHGGTLRLASLPEDGCVFVVEVPLSDDVSSKWH